MRRLFVSLYLSIAAALFVFLVAVPYLIERGLQGPLLGAASKFADTPRAIFEAELADVPQDEWHAHIEELKSEFGYQLELMELATVVEEENVLARLRDGDVSVSTNDEGEFVLLPMRGSNYVIKVGFAETEQERGDRSVRGFYHLLEKQLKAATAVERQTHFRELSAQASIPIGEFALADLVLSPDEEKILRAGNIVSHDIESNDETYFKAVAGSDRAVVIGPIGESFITGNMELIALSILGIIFGATVFLWLRPLIHDMRALDQGAAAFGDGKLDSRVVVSGRSPIRELTSTFNSMAVRIKALISAQKELTDSVSHELRTPIARLRFGMFRLENCNSHDDWQVAMDGMREDVDELDQLVDELLTFSRLKSADPNVSVQEVQVEPWLSQVTSNIEGVKENVEITSQLDTGLETVAFDPRLMARALSNLIRNAIRYARTSVKVTVQRGSEGVQLIVEDDGDGISDEHFERVFEPFVRVESRHSGESTGYGLGLAIVKRICDWHSAKVSAATSSMGGAKFVIHVGDQIDRSYAN